MTYMADLLARQYIGRPISGFDYVVYHFGPYPLETRETVTKLEAKGLAWEKSRSRVDEYDYSSKKLFDSGKPIAFDFTKAENEILAFVVRNYLNMDTDELVEDIVYETAPYRAAFATGKLKAPIPMETVDREALAEIGFSLERVLEAERQADEGHYVTGREYIDGLRNRIAARHPE